MFLENILILFLCAKITYQYQHYRWERFRTRENAVKIPHRLLELMRSYYEESNVRIAEINNMRFMYEESPHYEQGYIMGEIIERYRKIVEHVQRPHQFKSETVFATLKRVELTQKLYFEVYHLVRMMHESPQKYKYLIEFSAAASTSGMSLKELWAIQNHLASLEKRREKEKKRRRKINEKLRQAYMKGLSQSVYGSKHQPYNKWWPLDYGWELEEKWFG